MGLLLIAAKYLFLNRVLDCRGVVDAMGLEGGAEGGGQDDSKAMEYFEAFPRTLKIFPSIQYGLQYFDARGMWRSRRLQGYLADKKPIPPSDYHRALLTGLL